MDEVPEIIRYEDLGNITDSILEECDEDVVLLAEKIDRLPPQIRDNLLSSDFLNAYQAFYFFFRIQPAEIEMERMLLLPASELQYGIRLNEIELTELIFAVFNHEPVVLVGDGDRELARYTGKDAYQQALCFIESTL